jgi:hypothetical protein
MVFKTLLKLSVLVFCLMLISACGYMKDMKEKLNPNEAPVNVRTEEPASPTDGKVNPADESSEKDIKNGDSTSKPDDSNTEKSKKSSKSNLTPDHSTNR